MSCNNQSTSSPFPMPVGKHVFLSMAHMSNGSIFVYLDDHPMSDKWLAFLVAKSAEWVI